MGTITPPAPLPLRDGKWTLVRPQQKNRSKWTGTSKVIGLPGAEMWTCQGSFIPIVGEAAMRPWRGFFWALQGAYNNFPLLATESQQTTATNPTVGSGPGAANTLPVTGLTPGATVLRAGHMLTVPLPNGHARLAGLTQDLVADGSGHALAYLSNELGQVPTVGATIEIRNPYSLVTLKDPDTVWSIDAGLQYGFTLDVEEDL